MIDVAVQYIEFGAVRQGYSLDEFFITPINFYRASGSSLEAVRRQRPPDLFRR